MSKLTARENVNLGYIQYIG